MGLIASDVQIVVVFVEAHCKAEGNSDKIR